MSQGFQEAFSPRYGYCDRFVSQAGKLVTYSLCGLSCSIVSSSAKFLLVVCASGSGRLEELSKVLLEKIG
jgi:hypothetical protein